MNVVAESRLAALLTDLEVIRACTRQCEAMISDAGLRAMPRIWHWSPLGWQYGHVPCFEEQFVLVRLKGDKALHQAYTELFMPASTPPPERINLPGRDLVLEYLDEVRWRSLDYLAAAGTGRDVLFTVEMLVEHESMHLEHQLHMACWLSPEELRRVNGPMELALPGGSRQDAGAPRRAERRPLEERHRAVDFKQGDREGEGAKGFSPEENRSPGGLGAPASRRPHGAEPTSDGRDAALIQVPAGTVRIGGPAPDRPWDNELPAFEMNLGEFAYDRLPVTNGEFLQFIEAGGYGDRRWWSDAGWASIELTGALHPYYWRRTAQGWKLRMLFEEVELPLDHPVMGVSWFEAEAYARFAGKRLLTEFEWERAAQLAGGREGNFDFRHCGTVPAGSIGESPGESPGESARGLDLAGQVWEWTSSWFKPYEGFKAGPYKRYSEPQFGEVHKVLRGGCWATIRPLTRASFRNWYNPHLRQIFAGIRLAARP